MSHWGLQIDKWMHVGASLTRCCTANSSQGGAVPHLLSQLNVPHCIFLVCQECGWKRRFTTNRVGTHRDQLFLPFLGLLPGYALFSPQLREQFKMSSTIPRHGYSSHWCARLDFPLSTSSAGCGCFSPA